MMLVGCDISVTKQLWIWGLSFLGGWKNSLTFIVITQPKDSVVLFPCQG